MKKTFHVDDELLRRAREDSGASTDTETIRLGLQELVRKAAYERMINYFEPGARDVPRRRPEVVDPVPEKLRASAARKRKRRIA
jgi:hypothetical protein